ncbi:MAG: sigma-70 family RNA polymerase sigma factor, partial [Desulfobacterota bacterium]|nr:sigma-70 family RNA polymerase sigma factor [Thermodesulfobacteriota bacterium]
RYTPDAQVFTWLYRIAANHCLNFIRDRKNQPLAQALPQDAAFDTPVHGCQFDRLEHEERAQAVRQAIDRLPKRQRMALLLLRFEGMSYRDIAQVLGCSVGAVESLVARGMASLKEYLAAYKEQ